MRARVIFDSGSQKSYITQRARDQLNLPTMSTDSLLIKTFGTNVIDQLSAIRLKLSLKMSTRSQREKSKPLLCLLFVHRSETKRLILLKHT